jgi:hypothetical protein
MTKRLLMAVGLIACLALPATALGHAPSKTDKKNAAKECRLERGTTDATKEAFADKYGSGPNHKNAFGKCVSRRARDEQAERHAAKTNAARDCRAERKADPEAFKTKYGTAKSHFKNAFGKCVSQKAKQNKAAADKRDRAEIKREHRAAKDCATERSTLGQQAFAAKYGTSKNKHGNGNAFGKCVSQHVK